MPIAIEPSDRKLLLIAGAILLVMLVAFVAVAPPEQGQGGEFPTTYSSGNGGARAAYLLLQQLHYKVQRWEEPPTDLPINPRGRVLILANPLFPPSKKEQAALQEFVQSGGQVLFTGPMLGMFFPQAKLAVENPYPRWQTFKAMIPSRYTRGAEKIELRPQAYWPKVGSQQLSLYDEFLEGAAVVSWRMGKGEIVWWAGPSPLTNAGITREGNLNLFLNAMKPPGDESEGARIYWDEYFHGQRSSLWGYFRKTPVPMGLLQLGFLGLAVLFTFSRRSGPVARPAGVSRLSPLEFVDTLGGLYERAGAAPAAVGVAYQRFRTLLAQQLRLPANISDEDLARAAEQRLGQNAAELTKSLQQAAAASRATKLAPAEALSILHALEQFEEKTGLKKRKTEEKS